MHIIVHVVCGFVIIIHISFLELNNKLLLLTHQSMQVITCTQIKT